MCPRLQNCMKRRQTAQFINLSSVPVQIHPQHQQKKKKKSTEKKHVETDAKLSGIENEMVKVDGKIFLETIFILKKTQVYQIVPVLLRTLFFSISWVTFSQFPVFSDRLSPVAVGGSVGSTHCVLRDYKCRGRGWSAGSRRESKSLPLRILSSIGTVAPE